jgi:hypothetical protein
MQFDNPVKPKLTAECEFKTQAGSLADALSSQFNLIDLNRDGQISRSELKVFSQRPNLSSESKAVVSFLNDHLEDIGSLSNDHAKTLDRRAIEKLKDLASEDSQSPSATEFISRGALGGAAGGATADLISNGKVGNGSGKGAAIGAVVGVIAYAANEAQHNADLKTAETIKGWHYFDSTCNEHEQSNKPSVPERQQSSNHQKPKADDFRQLEKYLPQLDFNDDHEVSKAELKQAAQMGYVPDALLPALQFTADNLTEITDMNMSHINYSRDSVGVQASDLENFATTLQVGHVDDNRMTNKEYWTIVGGASAAGCGTGALVGTLAANPLAGCAVGGGIAGVGAMAVTYMSKHQADSFYPVAVHSFDELQKKLE